MSELFRKPAALGRRGDPSAFLNRDFNAEEKPAVPEATQAASPPPEPPPAPLAKKQRKETPVTTSLKMFPSSQRRLKRLALDLETSMSELIEEALDARWAVWEARARQHAADE